MTTDSPGGGLELDRVSVNYGETVAVDGVTLAAPATGVLALLGPSGCGKSTLLRAVAGLEPLTAGRVAFGGEDLAGVPVHRRQFGLMFQDSVLFGHRTVAGNIGYGLQMQRLPTTQRRGRIAEMLDLVGLPGYAERTVGTLSGGQAQRIALARALAPRPRLLLLDEPLAALDTALREQLLVDLRRILDASGTPAVFVTHDQDEAYAVADRVALMRAGRLVQQGTPAEVWERPADAEAARFLGYRVLLELPVGIAELDRFGTGPVAVRAGAFVVDPDGSLAGRIEAAVAGPDRTELLVRLDDGPVLPAFSTGVPPSVGTRVRLRARPDGAVPLPDGSAVPGGSAVAGGSAIAGGSEVLRQPPVRW